MWQRVIATEPGDAVGVFAYPGDHQINEFSALDSKGFSMGFSTHAGHVLVLIAHWPIRGRWAISTGTYPLVLRQAARSGRPAQRLISTSNTHASWRQTDMRNSTSASQSKVTGS